MDHLPVGILSQVAMMGLLSLFLRIPCAASSVQQEAGHQVQTVHLWGNVANGFSRFPKRALTGLSTRQHKIQLCGPGKYAVVLDLCQE